MLTDDNMGHLLGSPGWVSSSGLLLLVTLSALLLALLLNNRRQRDMRRTLKQLNLRYRRIIDGTNAGTWEWNVQTGAIVINARWAEMLGYQLAELQPTTIDTWINLTHPGYPGTPPCG